MSPIPQVADAEAKQAQLTRMKRRATGLLVLMGVVFVIAWSLEPAHAWLGYVRATAEAGLVGGVADWFAITALFRHPLNIPIPHTAIIPQRKDRIGRSLGNFVQNNFLSPEVLGAKLRAAGLSRLAAEWLREPEHARMVVRQGAGALRSATAVVRDDDVHALLERSVIEPLKRRPIAPVLADGLALLTVNDRHQQLLDRLIRGLTRVVAENQGLIRQKIREESPWWVPGFVDERVHERVVDGIERTLFEVSADSNHPLRQQLDGMLDGWIEQLRESPEAIARAEQIKQQVLDHPTSEQLSESLWREVKKVLDRQVDAAEQGAPGALERGLTALAQAALQDEALLAKVDDWIIAAVLRTVEQHRHEVGQLIAHTVSAWDPDETSRRIELQVGRDLQFIRINGTLVGGMVGLILYAVTHLAGGHP
ncbi:MAG TPA: DUF445 domain-containing protein [Gemmatimonadales bacterium]|jgi:uncharacterized membrane-anchored protein YjiN (DUF445 family)|nr:DUF445 domain-containing protein [Gemmatimonadales bacterium]